jgi:hypothetical protein
MGLTRAGGSSPNTEEGETSLMETCARTSFRLKKGVTELSLDSVSRFAHLARNAGAWKRQMTEPYRQHTVVAFAELPLLKRPLRYVLVSRQCGWQLFHHPQHPDSTRSRHAGLLRNWSGASLSVGATYRRYLKNVHPPVKGR